MAERAQGWREVRLGAVLTAVLVVVLLVIWIQRGRNPFGEAYFLLVFAEDAKGLQEGAPVTLSGVPVGEVERIDVLVPSDSLRAVYPDSLRDVNIRIVLQVVERYRAEITDRSRARLSTRGASGLRYVRIEKGPVGGDPLESGDRLPVAPALDPESLLALGTAILDRIDSLNRHAAQVAAKIQAGGGTLGRLVANPADNEVAENFEAMNAAAARVLRGLDEGPGTFALERRTGRIRANLERFRARVEEIQRGVREGRGSLGAFASDTALPRALERLQARATAVQSSIESGDGSLGRFLNDPELFDQIQLLTSQLDSLAAEVRADPLGSVDVDLH